ncbi:hypothetical protein [Caldalkalibacillus salinus]|uniref:hypothetical protein n=1 Tax=Caldalkalibacillus salinus TaxID=2803787 RepID=UPI001924534A|nr:hypothetical protein [Caldalkalibacillus salinus]
MGKHLIWIMACVFFLSACQELTFKPVTGENDSQDVIEEQPQPSEEVVDNEVVLAEEKGVSLRTNPQVDNDVYQDITVEIEADELTKTFPWTNVREEDYYPEMAFVDVTGDENEEIVIFLTTDIESGLTEQEVHVLTQDNLNKLDLEDPLAMIDNMVESSVSVEDEQVEVLIQVEEKELEMVYDETDAVIWNDEVTFGGGVNYELRQSTLFAIYPGRISPTQFAVVARVEYDSDLNVKHIEIEEY